MQKDFVGDPKTKSVDHMCQDEVKKHDEVVKAGSQRVKIPMARTVFLQPAIDPSYLVGTCMRCKLLITERLKTS